LYAEYVETIEADHLEIINWSPIYNANNIYLKIAAKLKEYEDIH
jgi:hypothetical protein